MSDRTIGVYDVRDCGVQSGNRVASATYTSLKNSTTYPNALPDIEGCAANDAISRLDGNEAGEDTEPYSLDFLPGEGCEADPEACSAAADYVKGLRNAQRDLDEVLNLSEVLRASVEEDGDSRAMQAEMVLKIIEKKVKKAHDRIDRHDTGCRALFLAYFELRDKQDKLAQ